MTRDEALGLLNAFGADRGIRVEVDAAGDGFRVHAPGEGATRAANLLVAALAVGSFTAQALASAQTETFAAIGADLDAIRLRAAAFGLHIIEPFSGAGLLVLREGQEGPARRFPNLKAVEELLHEAATLHAQAQVRRLVERLREATR